MATELTNEYNGYVYFMEDPVIKAITIGHSYDPKVRRKQHQRGNPTHLLILGAIPGGVDLEAEWHRRFKAILIPGHKSWFHGTPELREAIDRVLHPEPKLLGRKIASVYLAGKITGDPWREDILGPGCSREHWSVAGDNAEWFRSQVVPVPGWGRRLDYWGPFWLDPARHGFNPNNNADHSYGDPWNHLSTDHDLVRNKSLESIHLADLVFAWVDGVDCFGTIAEIAVAYSRVRQSGDYPIIIVATPNGFGGHYQMWFALGMAHHRIYTAESPAEAWDRLWTGKSRLRTVVSEYQAC